LDYQFITIYSFSRIRSYVDGKECNVQTRHNSYLMTRLPLTKLRLMHCYQKQFARSPC